MRTIVGVIQGFALSMRVVSVSAAMIEPESGAEPGSHSVNVTVVVPSVTDRGGLLSAAVWISVCGALEGVVAMDELRG